MIKVCMVSNTKTVGVWGGCTFQRAYHVKSSSRHRSCRDSPHTHTDQKHFSEVKICMWRRCGLEFFSVYRILSQIIPCVCVTLWHRRIRGCKDTCPRVCASMRLCPFMWMCKGHVLFALWVCFCLFFFPEFCECPDCLPSFCRVIVHSHQLFLHIRLTLQTLLVTLPHPHQRLPPERLSGILAEICSPHLYASETCWSQVISLSLSLFVFYVWSWLTL